MRSAVCIIASVVAALALRAAQAEPLVPIAILPIVVHSADDPSYLRSGLADMLASRIEQAGGFRVIRVEDVAQSTTRLERAVAIGKSLGAHFVLFGSFTRFGTGASLDMQCASTRPDFGTDPLREIFVHTGSIGEVIPDLDDLVGKVGRFAIAGFGEKTDVASPPPGDAEGKRVKDLEARVQALEKAVAKIEAGVGPAKP